MHPCTIYDFDDSGEHPALGHGVLKSGAPYQVKLLAAAHVDAIAALHTATIAGLDPGQESYILPKDALYFSSHLAKGNGNAVIGIVSNRKLVAQALIRHPDLGDPDDGMVDIQRPSAPDGESILQAVSVAPDHRGLGLMGILVDHWIAHAGENNRPHLWAEIDVRNQASWRGFLHAGLALESIGKDPSDGTLVYNAHRILGGAAKPGLTAIFADAARCAPDDLAAQRRLFADGRVCVAFDGPRREMVFAPAAAYCPH